MSAASSHVSRADTRRSISLGWLAALLIAVALGPFVQELTAQPASRYAQTAAMTDQSTVKLDAYASVLNVDFLVRDGHIYGDKAPLQPILAMPFYAAAQAVGAEPATVLQIEGNLGLWWVTLWSTVVPLMVLAAVGVRVNTRLFGSSNAAQATLAICCGTLLMAYGTQLYAHVLAGLLGWSCWLLADSARRSATRGVPLALAAGAFGGAAVATEYPMLIVVVVVGVAVLADRHWIRFAVFVAGGVPFVGLLMAYQAAAYGSPFSVSYSEKTDPGTPGVVVGLPTPARFLEVLFGTRGLLLFSPIVVLAVWGLAKLARSDASIRRHGVVGLTVFVGFLVMQSGWPNAWGGEAAGPRYVIPSLPFLIVGMGRMWNEVPRFQWLAIRWSVLAMASTVLALHLTPTGSFAVVAQLQNIRDFGLVPTLWTLWLGPLGFVPHLLSIGGVAWMLSQAIRARQHVVTADEEGDGIEHRPQVVA